MYKRHIFTLLFLCCVTSAYPNGPPLGQGARTLSLGQAYAGVHGDFWSLFNNPAGIVGIQSLTFGVYAEQRFLLKELNQTSAGLIFPFLENQSLGLYGGSFGFSAYRENVAALNYAIRIGDRVNIGSRFTYFNTSITDFGAGESLIVDVGIQISVTKTLSIGAFYTNVNNAYLETQSGGREDLDRVLSVGLAYQASNQVLIVCDWAHEEEYGHVFRGGIEYLAGEKVYLRFGLNNRPLRWSGGVGIKWKRMKLDMAVDHREFLGLSPHISLEFSLQKTNKT